MLYYGVCVLSKCSLTKVPASNTMQEPPIPQEPQRVGGGLCDLFSIQSFILQILPENLLCISSPGLGVRAADETGLCLVALKLCELRSGFCRGPAQPGMMSSPSSVARHIWVVVSGTGNTAHVSWQAQEFFLISSQSPPPCSSFPQPQAPPPPAPPSCRWEGAPAPQKLPSLLCYKQAHLVKN